MTDSKVDSEWMQQALALARQAMDQGEVPVGAILVRDGEVLGTGYNQPISTHDPTAHAEIVALRSAASAVGNYRLPGATLYVTIEPCTMCVGAMIHARISRVVFGAREPRAGAVCSAFHLLDEAAYNHSVKWNEGVLASETSALIRDYFREKRQ
jgi:tRNA(adenine34) deaminase